MQTLLLHTDSEGTTPLGSAGGKTIALHWLSNVATSMSIRPSLVSKKLGERLVLVYTVCAVAFKWVIYAGFNLCTGDLSISTVNQ